MTAPQRPIILVYPYPAGSCYVADFAHAAPIVSRGIVAAFGQYDVPLPFAHDAHLHDVIVHLERRHPDHDIRPRERWLMP